jgi:hypothetical protein
MTFDEDFDRFTERLTMIAVIHRQDIAPAFAAFYFELLKDLPIDDVLPALNAHARDSKFFPKPAEIRALVQGGDDATFAEIAWLTWRRIAEDIGAYRSPTFEDPALAETLIAVFGSWADACIYDESPEMLASKRKEFERVYRVMRARGLTGLRRLVGLHERDNTEKGYQVDTTGQPIFDEHGQPRRLEAGARPSEPKALPPVPEKEPVS